MSNALPLPNPYLPGAPGSGLGDVSEFADRVQQNFDKIATGTLPISDISAFIRTLLNDANASTARTTLGLGSGDNVTFNQITANAGVTALGGQVSLFSYTQFPEVADPVAVANKAFLYARDNGSGKTQLCVQFGSGAVQVIATEP